MQLAPVGCGLCCKIIQIPVKVIAIILNSEAEAVRLCDV